MNDKEKRLTGEYPDNRFVMCALRRTFRLRAMGALSQVKVLNMPR